jgi:ATP-dependent Clp protease ATP-binding subunit ClpA
MGARVVDPSGPADARALAVVVTASTGVTAAAVEPLGFLLAAEAQETDALGGLPPELLARFDDVVRFRELAANEVAAVASRALVALVGEVGRRHGVRLRVTPEAASFAAERAAEAGLDVREARAIVERLVHGPLSALVLTGKLTRHPAWAAVYDEGGIYLLPEA